MPADRLAFAGFVALSALGCQASLPAASAPTASPPAPPSLPAPVNPPDSSDDRGDSQIPEPIEEPLAETDVDEPAGPAVEEEPERCPPEMSLVLESVCVDRWEASLVERLADGTERPWSPYHTPKARDDVRAVSQPGVVPQGYVSGELASQFCRASGKRLCTAEEWEAACRGPGDTTFPYGDVREPGACNEGTRRGHPVVEAARRLGIPEERMWRDAMADPIVNQLPNTVRKTGELERCTNETGTHDMVGNLHEWIDDPAGTFRGGFYMDARINGEGCDYATTAHPMSYYDYSTGFRCCRDAERSDESTHSDAVQ